MDRIKVFFVWLAAKFSPVLVALVWLRGKGAPVYSAAVRAVAWLHSKFPRMTWSSVAVGGLAVFIFGIAPWRIDLLAYKLLSMGIAAVGWYYLCRELLAHNRPSLLLEPPDGTGFRAIKAGCQTRYYIGIILQGGGSLIAAAIVGVTM